MSSKPLSFMCPLWMLWTSFLDCSRLEQPGRAVWWTMALPAGLFSFSLPLGSAAPHCVRVMMVTVRQWRRQSKKKSSSFRSDRCEWRGRTLRLHSSAAATSDKWPAAGLQPLYHGVCFRRCGHGKYTLKSKSWSVNHVSWVTRCTYATTGLEYTK